MASLVRIGSTTSAGILFRTVLVVVAFLESLRMLDRGIHLFAPVLWPIYVQSGVQIEIVATALWLLIIWAVILLAEMRSWTDVSWTGAQAADRLLLGAMLGSGVYLFYVAVIVICGWLWFTRRRP